jgi:TetR/AcrR family transcriptional repressor of lmrAB and yxaGH operons
MKTPAAPRDRIIEAAITLMRRSGYSGVGINEVLAESGAPKGSMYHYFPGGKRQVVTESLEAYARRVVAFMDENLAKGATPAEKLAHLFAAFEKRLQAFDYRQSCAAGCVSLDLDDDLSGVRGAVQGAFSEYVDVIERHLELRNRRRAHSFAGFVLTAIEGAYVRGRAEHSVAAFREAGQWLARLAEQEAAAA